MIVIIFVALTLYSGNCLASYYYQTQSQLQAPLAITYDGYQGNYQPYQNAAAIQYYTSSHIPAPAPFAYQPPTSYFEGTIYQPRPIYNIAQPVPIQIQPPAHVTLQKLNNTANSSPQMRGFIYHTDLQGGARSNVVFFNGPATADLFQQTPIAVTSMRTPVSNSVDSVAVDAAVSESQRPADHFQSLFALLNQQPSGGSMFIQDGILYSNNRVVANDRFLATDDQNDAEDVLPILRSSFIARRVTSPELPETGASERQSKNIETVTSSSERTTTTTTTNTVNVNNATVTDPPATTTPATKSTSTSSITSESTMTMTPIVVAEMVES